MAWFPTAPGRVNLIGEHTDDNEGFVMPLAIDRAIRLELRTARKRMGIAMNSLVVRQPGANSATRDAGVAVALFLLALGIYGGSAAFLGRTASPKEAYFDHLADALLHGQTFLVNPPSTYDLTLYQGRWYVPFLPLPAMLLMPWVAVSGVSQVNTVAFGAFAGAVNVGLVFLLLQSVSHHGWTRLKWSDNVWLTALWGIGSVHWYMSTIGNVWFVSQICAVTFLLLAVWSAVTTQSPLLSGAALALAMWARPNIVLSFPLLVAIGIEFSRDVAGLVNWRSGLRWGLVALGPVILSVAGIMAYNDVRFNDPFDFGYKTENVANDLVADLNTYGQFNLHYVPHNFWAMLLAGPVYEAKTNTILPSIDGMSLLLTTPALLSLFRSWKRSALVVGAWLSVGLLLIPVLAYYNTGWWQFGYRFSLDLMTPLVLLIAIGAGARVGWTLRVLILLGVVVNAWGTWWYLNPRFFILS
jgi:Galactokinase galactose-binding signature